MKKQLLSTEVLSSAQWSYAYVEGLIPTIANLHNTSLMRITSEVLSVMPALSQCFPKAIIHTSTRYIPIHDLFTGKGPMASKLLEHATLSYILNGNEYDFNKAKDRIKELFDYSDQLLLDKQEKGFDHKSLTAYTKYIVGYCKNSEEMVDSSNRISFSSVNKTYAIIPVYSWKLELVNDSGVTIKSLDQYGRIEYVHPNENISSVATSSGLIFKNDAELIEECLNDFFISKGFKYKDYISNNRLIEIRNLMERIVKHGEDKSTATKRITQVKTELNEVSLTQHNRANIDGLFNGYLIANLIIDSQAIRITSTENVGEDSLKSAGVVFIVNDRYCDWYTGSKSIIGEQILLNKAEDILNQWLLDLEKTTATQYPSFSLLTAEEEVFVKKIIANPGSKIDFSQAFSSEDKSLWDKPLDRKSVV